ncbi:MAG: lipid-A-disaccharide synthase [Rhodobacteraceae bacterium]|nr:lipid-A-disaccharide synthase [Paracoccaceae bacterium]
MNHHYFLIAGEESGDQLGAGLIHQIREIDKAAQFSGVGGGKMIAAGLNLLFHQSELAVMGITEILPRLPQLLSRIRHVADEAASARVSAMITIDSPDFSFRVARQLRRRLPTIPIVQYVCPSVWAWRRQRVEKMRELFDLVLTLLPFEPDLLRKAGIAADFVGHPTAEIKPPGVAAIQRVRDELGLHENGRILLVLPGSRQTEVMRLSPIFGQVAQDFTRCNSQFQIVVPVGALVQDQVRAETAKWQCEIRHFCTDQYQPDDAALLKTALFSVADLALAASGTVTLELAASSTPSVTAYDVHILSRLIISKLLKVKTVALTNIILDERVIPELLGASCTPQRIGQELEALWANPALQERQIAAGADVMRRLRSPARSSSVAAAEAVIKLVATRAEMQDNRSYPLRTGVDH